MTFDEIAALVRHLEGRAISGFEYSESGTRLKLLFRQENPDEDRSVPAAPSHAVAEPVVVAVAPSGIAAPCVGRFVARHPLGDVLPSSGADIGAGTIVGFVAAGGLNHPVTADRPGRLGACLVEEGAILGFGTPVFAFTPLP